MRAYGPRSFKSLIMSSIHRCALVAALTWLVMTLGTPGPAVGAEAPSGNLGSDSTRPELTGTDLETFLDALVPTQLARDQIAGAVVVVVKDGKVLLAKGFGYANVETSQPTTPATLFRPGSIYNLFNGIAVMQLAEHRTIDLDHDVTDYRDVGLELLPA